MTRLINRLKRMFIVGLRQIQDPYYHGFAAQISFYFVLSIVPIVLLLIQLLGLFNINSETVLEIFEQYTGNHMSDLITSLFEFNYIGFGNIIFFLIAMWAGSRASFAIARITNYTLTEGKTTGKNYFFERARAIITMLLTMISMVVALIVLCYGRIILLGVSSLFRFQDTSLIDNIWFTLRWPLGFALFFLIISFNYYILPTQKMPFKMIVPGAFFAALGMIVVSWVYSFYTETLVNYDITYGALSTIVAIMIWFLLLSWVIILGVMCNKVFADTAHPFSKRVTPEEVEKIRDLKQHSYYQSKFDMDPDEVSIHTIKDILTGTDAKAESGSEEKPRKPINKL